MDRTVERHKIPAAGGTGRRIERIVVSADTRPLRFGRERQRLVRAAENRNGDIVGEGGVRGVGQRRYALLDAFLRNALEQRVKIDRRVFVYITQALMIDLVFQAVGGEDKAQHIVIERKQLQLQPLQGVVVVQGAGFLGDKAAVADHLGLRTADDAKRAVAQIAEQGNIELLEDADEQQRAVHRLRRDIALLSRLFETRLDISEKILFQRLEIFFGNIIRIADLCGAEPLHNGLDRHFGRDMRIAQCVKAVAQAGDHTLVVRTDLDKVPADAVVTACLFVARKFPVFHVHSSV